jgi:hypothetical protein
MTVCGVDASTKMDVRPRVATCSFEVEGHPQRHSWEGPGVSVAVGSVVPDGLCGMPDMQPGHYGTCVFTPHTEGNHSWEK